MNIGIKTPYSQKLVFNRQDLEHILIRVEPEIRQYYEEFYNFVRVLSHNNTFIKAWKKIRDEYEFDKILSSLDNRWNIKFPLTKKSYYKYQDLVDEAASKLFKLFKLESKWEIYFGGLVSVGYFRCGEELIYDSDISFYDDKDKNKITINIYYPISKNKFDKYIKSLWPSLGKIIKQLPTKQKNTTSERDFRIYELKKTFNKKHKDIPNQIIKEFKLNNYDGALNEDSVKTAYKRVRKIISSINKK